MQSPFSFIVRPVSGKRYDNVKKIGDLDFLISVSKEDHKASNRYGQVVSVPIGYKGEINIGDILLVHHNVFKYYNDIYGRQKSGRSWLIDDLFLVDSLQFYMYKQDGKWFSHDKYCFVKPVPVTESYIHKPFAEEPLMGKMKYINKTLQDNGIKEGDLVTFKPDTEYEFTVEGEKLYRMFDHHITMVL